MVAAAVVTRVLAGETAAAARGVFFAGIALVVIGLVVSARTGRFGSSPGFPLSALEPQQRRQMIREVQGRRPADPAHSDVARSFAHRQSRPSPGLPFLFGGLVLMGVAGLFGRPSGLRIAGVTAALAFFVALLVLGALQADRARRFLAEHPAPPDVTEGER
jgi:hypothetical protein